MSWPVTDLFRKKRKTTWRLGLAACAAFAVLLSGYTVSIRTNLMRGAWPLDAPIQWRIWQGFTDQQASVVDGSQPQLAIREALERWARIAPLPIVLLGTTSAQEVGADQQNIITIANTANNLSVVGDAAGIMVVQMHLNSATNRADFVEADLLLNPTLQWSTIETTDPDVHGILSVAQHEFGHAWNLQHSISRSSSMFYAAGPDFDPGFNQLAWDDIAGVNLTYPLPGISEITGAISGQVTMNGSPVFGAFVIAVDESGALSANAITMQDGSYTIENLPPGQYTLYVEPLDGPTQPENIGGGLYTLPMTANFLPRLYNDTTDAVVQVQAGHVTTGRNFQVTQGNATIDPELLAVVGDEYLTTAPPGITQGESAEYAMAGAGLNTLLGSGGLFLAGDRVSAGKVPETGQLNDGTPLAIYPVTTTPDAVVDEGYPVFLTDGTHLGVITGGFKVYSPWRFLQAFAQFANLSNATSGLFLINTDRSADAEGQINVRDALGAGAAVSLGSLSGSGGDLDFSLAPGGSLLANSHGTDFVGSLRARGERRLGGTVLFETPFGTTGVGPSEPAYSFIVPIEVKAGGATVNTGIALTNLDTRNAQVFLRAHNTQGAAVSGAQAVISLAANGHVARFIADGANSLVPNLPANFDGNLTVTSTRRLGGAAIRTAPGVFTTLPVIQNRVTPDTYFAQFVHAGGLSSRLILVNPSPYLSARVVVQIRNSAGAQASVGLNGQLVANGRQVVQIPPLGRADFNTTSGALVGSVQVSSRAPDGNNLPVGGVVLFGSQSFGTTGVGESRPMTRMVIPVSRNVSAGVDTGVALVNADSRVLTVHLEARDLAGAVVRSKTITLAVGAQLARYVNEDPLLLNLGSNFTGSLWIEVDGLIGAMSIRQSPGVLTTFPVITLEEPVTL